MNNSDIMNRDKKIAFILLALIVIIIFINLNDKEVINNELIQLDESKNIIIPVKVHLIKEPSNSYSTQRDEENILKVFENVNKIWIQAEIQVKIDEIVTTKVEEDTIPNVMGGQTYLLKNLDDFDNTVFNAYFASDIGPNGIAFTRDGTFMIADVTSVHDFRATSHEIGHLLGLVHVSDINQLMFRGTNGMVLRGEEINTARKNAIILFN